MGKKLSRREFVRRAAVAAASAAFAGKLGVPPAPAPAVVDPNAKRTPDEMTQEVVEIYEGLSPEAQRLVTIAMRGLLAARRQAAES